MASLRIADGVANIGGFFSLVIDSFQAMFRRPFALQEFLEQTRFIAGVSIMPAIFTTIPFLVVVQFFLGQLIEEIGAIDLAGAGAGLAILEIGPFVSVLVVSGAGATAVCADLGARKIREELDAIEVLGIDPRHRLVAPRILAFIMVSIGIFGISTLVGLIGTFVFSTLVLGASPGLFVSNLTLISPFSAWIVAFIKTVLFGIAAALVACYLGMNAKGGPKGVGEAVNQTVIFTLMVLVVINATITSVYLQLFGS